MYPMKPSDSGALLDSLGGQADVAQLAETENHVLPRRERRNGGVNGGVGL
jgi:hypothetical protein